MQLSLMMITGYVIADSRLVKGGIVRLIGLTTTARSTLMVFCLIVGAVTWLHWAAGLMVAIVLGKEVAIRKRGLGLHYPGLVAAAYIMVNVMANGLSQSAPLLAATAGNFLEKTIGGTIPLTQTALSPSLLAFVGFQFVSLPIIIWLMVQGREGPGNQRRGLQRNQRPAGAGARPQHPASRRALGAFTRAADHSGRRAADFGSPAFSKLWVSASST